MIALARRRRQQCCSKEDLEIFSVTKRKESILRVLRSLPYRRTDAVPRGDRIALCTSLSAFFGTAGLARPPFQQTTRIHCRVCALAQECRTVIICGVAAVALLKSERREDIFPAIALLAWQSLVSYRLRPPRKKKMFLSLCFVDN